MNRDDIIRWAQEAGFVDIYHERVWIRKGYHEVRLERFAALVAAAAKAEEREKYSPIGTVAGGAGERTFMHPSVKYILPIGLQLYARIEVREEDKV